MRELITIFKVNVEAQVDPKAISARLEPTTFTTTLPTWLSI
jgi:hypothetical protein